MKKTRFTEEHIVRILKEVTGGKAITDAARQYGMSENTIYTWRMKYGDMNEPEVRRLREIEAEDRLLKEIISEQALNSKALKLLLSKTCEIFREARRCGVDTRG